MKKMILTLVLAMFTIVGGMAQDVFGKWKTIDDATGEAKSIVEIYKKDGKVFGKVVEILNPDKQDATCVDCPSYAKDKPIKGLVILRNLKKNKNEYDGGTILDPNTGKEYKSYIALESEDILKVRGYIGFSLMGRSQYWHRVK